MFIHNLPYFTTISVNLSQVPLAFLWSRGKFQKCDSFQNVKAVPLMLCHFKTTPYLPTLIVLASRGLKKSRL